MDASKTLREIVGLGNQPPSLGDAALILVDIQNTYREGIMQLVDVEPAVQEAQRLLEAARAAGAPIFHIRHDAGPGSPYDVTAAIGQISDEVAPHDGEPVITKHYPNSFHQTDLEQRLREKNISNVIIAGFMTHVCINSTTRGAFNLGFAPTVIASATATRNLPGLDGKVVSAESLQAASLAALGDIFAIVVPETKALDR